MPLTPATMNDLLRSALAELGEGKWTDLSTDIQEFYGLPQLLKEEKVVFDGGTSIQRNIMVDHQHSARATELFEVDDVNIREQFRTIDIPWRHATASYAFERREVAMCRGPRQLLDLVKARRAGAMVALSVKVEEWLFSKLSTDDGKTPFGIPYWVNKYPAATTTPGFTGANPFGSGTHCGGLNHARWRNYAGQYTAVTKADLVAKMRRAARRTDFKSPVSMPQYAGPPRRQIYTTIGVIEALETLAEQQNDSLGRDIASMDGNVVFRRIPINWVPYLEYDADAGPVYMIDWGVMRIAFLSGEYMNEQGPTTAPNQHTVSRVFIDMTYNVLCEDVRRQTVLSTTTDKT